MWLVSCATERSSATSTCAAEPSAVNLRCSPPPSAPIRRVTRPATAATASGSRCPRWSTIVCRPARQSPAEHLPAAREEARIGTAEGLDRRVRISDEHDPCAAARDDPEEPGGSRGHLLGVVDDDEAQDLTEPRERRGGVLEHIGRRGEHPGGVIGAVPAERGHLVVLAKHLRGGDPLGSVVLAAEAVQVLGGLAMLDRASGGRAARCGSLEY